jgi:electron transfer flavoprotein alpha subunit
MEKRHTLRRIAVCIKQIPLVEESSFDPVTKTIRRDGPAVISAFDLRAIALGVGLKTRFGAEVTVVTMGPPQARRALEDALGMGADYAVHLEDRAFAGSDTLATARALALFLRREAFDLILLGKYSLDAETGQVGPEVAELLGIAQITGVRKLEIAGPQIRAERESDEGFDEIECEMPALLTCAERVAQPLRVNPEALKAAKLKPVTVLRASDLDADAAFGFAGSPTWVREVYAVESKPVAGRAIDARDPERAAAEVVAALEELGVFAPRVQTVSAIPSRIRTSAPDRDVWVGCERHLNGEITRATFELLSAAVELAEGSDGAVTALTFGSLGHGDIGTLAAHGADQILSLEDLVPDRYSPDTTCAAVADLVREYRPWALLVAASERGRDWMPRLAARLGLGLTGDAIGLSLDGEGRLVALKPAFGGNIVAPILSKTLPQMATVRPGVLELRRPNPARTATVIRARSTVQPPLTRLLGRHRLLDESVAELEGAEVVVGIGTGVGSVEGVEEVKKLARVMNAALCATRKVTDAGWVARQLQVGLTGKAIAPRLYFAVGIRGAANHLVGIKRAETIVAINNDPEAPIFERAALRLIGDWKVLVPALTTALARRAAQKSSASPQ